MGGEVGQEVSETGDGLEEECSKDGEEEALRMSRLGEPTRDGGTDVAAVAAGSRGRGSEGGDGARKREGGRRGEDSEEMPKVEKSGDDDDSQGRGGMGRAGGWRDSSPAPHQMEVFGGKLRKHVEAYLDAGTTPPPHGDGGGGGGGGGGDGGGGGGWVRALMQAARSLTGRRVAVTPPADASDGAVSRDRYTRTERGGQTGLTSQGVAAASSSLGSAERVSPEPGHCVYG